MIAKVVVRPNAAGAGWFVLVTRTDGQETSSGVIFDMALVLAQVNMWTARMLLGHEVEP